LSVKSQVGRRRDAWQSVVALALAAFATVGSVQAETALVAAASNFAEASARIADDFEAETGHQIKVSVGSTGKLYAQIRAGAPFDVLLAADQMSPEKLAADGLAVAESRFTYAIGRLTLWSADPKRVAGDPKTLLANPAIRAIAIANPALAPYGLAARQALQKLGVWQQLNARIVTAENVGQAFALTATGNAELGFVARPLLESRRGKALGGSRWEVPVQLHAPIRQDAVLLKRAETNKAARDFLAFLRGAKARAIMAQLGYNSATE
jgi:molybdate transport system substrate-binding protein